MDNGKEKVVYNACQGWGCHEHCVLTTHVIDGRIDRTERTILKGSQAEAPGICHKGIIIGKFPYLPERVLYPLKRVGERGEGKFERISWQQAMDEIGAKINESRDNYGPRSVVVGTFVCGYPNNLSALGISLQYGFVDAFDASHVYGPEVDISLLNMTGIDYGDPTIFLRFNSEWLARSKNMIMIWGGNPIGWTRAAHTSRVLMDAQENGVKIVHIGVLCDSTAAKADQFIPIRPGTDGAMALAMANTLIQEHLYDEEFLKKHTVAPFLVREDTGLFLRESDISPDGDPAKYVYWNKVPSKPVGIASHTYDLGEDDPDLHAGVIVNGIQCKTSFLKLCEHLAQWTPESQEAITGVPASTVLQLAREYALNRPSTIFMNYGLRYINGTNTGRAISLLPVLSGNLGLKEGRFMVGPCFDGHPVMLNELPILAPEGIENVKGGLLKMEDLLDSFEKSDGQQYKVWINTMSNPVQNWPNRKLWANQVFPNMDLVVVIEVRMSDTALFADYVLPEATIFEREELICPYHDCIVLNEPAIEPMGESKPPADIWYELTRRVGLGHLFNKTTEEWNTIRLQTSDPAIAGLTPPLTLERLRREKIVRLNVPDEVYDAWEDLHLITPSGRVEFYCEDLADVGSAMSNFIPAQIHGPKRKKYPLQFFPGRHRFFMQGQLQEIPELRALAGKKAVVALNPVDAKPRGIGDGDWVEVFNDKGAIQVKAHLSEAFPPGMAHVWYSYSAKDYPTDPPTVLSTSLSTNEAKDALSVKWGTISEKRFPGFGLGAAIASLGRTNETYWDDVCEVRKLEEVAK